MNETFFSTIAGASVALIGVLISLREERKKAKEEREFNAKQRSLLAAAEAVIRFLNYYITLPDRNLPEDGTVPDEAQQFSVALNSLHFYVGFETIKYSMKMSQVLITSHTAAIKAKLSIMFIIADITALDAHISSLETINKQIQQEILVLLPSTPTEALLASRRQQLVNNFQNIADLHIKKSNLFKEKYNATEHCRDVIKNDLKGIYGAMKDMLLAIRKELGFPIDENEYSNLINQSTEITLASIESLYYEIRTQVKQKLEQSKI